MCEQKRTHFLHFFAHFFAPLIICCCLFFHHSLDSVRVLLFVIIFCLFFLFSFCLDPHHNKLFVMRISCKVQASEQVRVLVRALHSRKLGQFSCSLYVLRTNNRSITIHKQKENSYTKVVHREASRDTSTWVFGGLIVCQVCVCVHTVHMPQHSHCIIMWNLCAQQ